MYQESETIELKSIVVDDIKKEIVAFANSDGGKLYVGIGDDGKVTGIDNVDEAILQIGNMIRDNIKPDVTMFVHYEVLVEKGKQIVEVTVSRGTSRPYYIAKKGMRPEGVYVRQGNSSVSASDFVIRQMIKETDGDSYEEIRSHIQDLSFVETKKEFELREVEFGQNQMRTLWLSDKDGLYTNLGLLISDQCLHTIKVAVFEGLDQSVFKDRKEFSGSIFKQMNEVYDFIDYRNQKHSSINGLYRTDIRDYPEVALRESLMNMLVHRDYSFSASSIINIYEDRIEFISIGGLLSGVELDDVLNGISICRNPKLANLFYLLELIESYGTGLNKIFNAYEGTNYKPRIIATKNSFKVILPNLNYDGQASLYQINDNMLAYTINEEDAVLNYLKKHNKITRLETEHLLNTSSSTAYRLLRKMHENGLLIQCGRAKNIEYKLAQKR